MHYASHLLMHCIALWCAISGAGTARNAVSPEILANFAKNVASVISPAILGEIQSRSNRSNLADQPAGLNYPDSSTILDNIVDKTSNVPAYYDSRVNSYNGLYQDVPAGLEESRAGGGFEESLRGETYLRQEQPNLYDRPYSLSPSNGNFEGTQSTIDSDIVQPSIGHIEESSSNRYSSYRGAGHGPFPGAQPHAGFPGFGLYGHYAGHHHHHHHPYYHYGNGEAPTDGATPEENARIERNDTNRRGYGPPYFGDYGYHHPYSSFPYGGGYHDYDPFYGGPYRKGENDSSGTNGRYGPYGGYGGPDFYGPYDGHSGGYGYGYGGRNNNNNNGDGSSSRQTEEPTNDGDQNNGTKNGYPGPYGPHLFRPFLGGFHGFPSLFKPLPYDHHFLFKGGPVGVGHVGYPIYADPYPIGFPFHHPYGPPFYGKRGKYPNGKPDDSGEQTEAPAGELAEDVDPGRITALNVKEATPASSSNRYKTSSALRKSLKRLGLSIENRKI